MNRKLPSCRLFLFALFVQLPWLSGAQQSTVTSALDNAEVRIPYLELRKLWESANSAAKTAEPEPLPAGALLSAQFKANLTGGNVTLEADFKVESFAGKWEKIRLMGAGLAVANVEPADIRLVVEGDDLCVMAKDIGPLALKVRFVESRLPAGSDTPFLKLSTAPSAVASLTIEALPDGRVVKTKDGVLQSDAARNCSMALPAKGGEVSLILTEEALVPKAEPPPPPPQPSEWTLQNEVLVFEGEGELSYRVRVHALALNGSALEATLLLPPNARGVKVEGDDLATSRQVRNAEGQTELRLRWQTRDLTEREVRLAYSLQQLPLAESWELRAPSLPDEDKVKSLFMFGLPAGVEFKAPNLQAPVPAAKLPRWAAAEVKVAEFGSVSGGSSASVQSRLLPRMDTAAAIITKSDYSTKLMGDGSVLTEAVLEVEHDASLRWSFSLPEKCELLKCAVDETPLKPIAREDGVMEIPLSHEGTASRTSNVKFSFTCTKQKLDAVEGAAPLELPLTPLFIRELTWSVELPESYEVTGIDPAELAAPGASAASPNCVRLVKKLCRNERPEAQVFYRKRGVQ